MTRKTASPPEGGSYDQDEEGELTGIVREAAAMELMPRIVASFTVDEIADAYRRLPGTPCRKRHHERLRRELDGAAWTGLRARRRVCDARRRGAILLRAYTCFPTLLDDMGRFEACAKPTAARS